ncbi:MAG: hypothetical protein A2W25_05685 [candidate division Zixibacteria bacterium RBG_16_53_22]|nr:MAG: hypothetical protein A2W25_05685 [candidate division Zixibacteria bacterium RBG_16_53_22]
MMNCINARIEIDARLRKGSAELPIDVRCHVDDCPACAAHMAELIKLQSILERTDFRVRPGELDGITFERIAEIARGRRPEVIGLKWSRPAWLWAPVAVAAAIILVSLIPKLANHVPSTTAINTASSITSAEVINDIARSEGLGDEFLTEMAGDMNVEYIAQELIEGSDIEDLLHGLTQSEMKALSDKIDNLPGMGSTGKG